MKLAHKVFGGVLVAATVLTLAQTATTTKAAPGDEVVGKGKITFTEDLTTLPSNVPGGASSQAPSITSPSQNTTPSARKIISVTDLDFDVHSIVATDTANKTYKAVPFETTEVATGKDVKIAHFVRYQDIRSTVAENHYSVKAELTKQFTNSSVGGELNGATLTYKNISLQSGFNPGTLPTTATALPASTQTLSLNQPEVFVNNKEAGKGYGVQDIVFGTNADAASSNYDSVDLNVLGTTRLKSGEYQAEITWTIEDAI
ncbi:WxL domain-containing protein [Enterococcus termitis]|uniref:WxL domain-containing protein n=1 Tax=Enterococcus termitis TaxID=332950 RepID=A0A1E5H162_9ENTE|nr:WxL domain-containing protein [Enterococcus termitis]OEG18636.1 hypothetical protein BCR25_15650 [Enterococcus termitis]OJG97647.1 hypothetical protein RV18_GL000715 [Enterococcus termitis]